MNILTLTDKALEEQHDKILKEDLDYEAMTDKLFQQCKAFEGLKLIPDFMIRGKGKESKYIEFWISMVQSKIGPGGKRRVPGLWGPPKEKKVVVHRRIIKGTPKEMASMAFKIIREAKKAAEVFTVLEETCSEAD